MSAGLVRGRRIAALRRSRDRRVLRERGRKPATTNRRFPQHGRVAAVAFLFAVALVVSFAGSANAVNGLAGVYRYHYDLQGTGADLQETALTPSTVNTNQFGKLASFPLDGRVYASPLYIQSLDMGGLGTHDVVFVATEHDSVYAFDAHSTGTTPLWKRSFIDPANGVTTVPAADTGELNDIPNEIGITSTPVIDPASDTMYVVVKTKEVVGGNTSYVQRLHAIDIRTGLDRGTAPSVVITASVPGTGMGSSGGTLTFNSLRENQRPAVLLYNGTVYLCFSSHGDHEPFHGWVLGYNATTLARTAVFASTPNGDDGGIWMSGSGPTVDSDGSLFVITGDGQFDANTGGNDYGDSVLRLSGSGSVLDYFSPSTQSTLNTNNVDLGASGALLLPDQSGAHTHELVTVGKDGTIYLIDRANMGHFNASGDQDVQTISNVFTKGSGITGDNFSPPVYFNGSVFFGPVGNPVYAFSLTNGLLSTTSTSKTTTIFGGAGQRGSALAVSANGTNDPNGILWALESTGSSTPGVLHAYLASNLNTELWNSRQAGGRDTLDAWEKFSPPVIANGEVFVAGVSQLTVYGLLPSGSPQNTAAPTVSGTPQVGQTLTENDGTWTGSPTPTLSRVWQSCVSGTCSNISGQTGTTYVVQQGDVGATIRVAVTGSNSNGNLTAFSTQTATVTGSAPPPGTLGRTTIGASTDVGWNGLKWGNKYVLPAQGTFTKVSAYLKDNPSLSGGESFRAAIYADASGAPGALVAQSAVVAVTDGQAAGWVDFAISPSVTLPAGTYWVVLQGGTPEHGALRYGDQNGVENWNADAFADGLANPFGTVNTGTWVWSLYATYS